MKMMFAAGLFAAAALGGAALADDHDLAFEDVDANGDGRLSLLEVQDAASDVAEATFNEYDADDNGFLSRSEFDAWKEDRMSEDDEDGGYDR